MMHTDEAGLRRMMVEQCRWMNTSGLNQGTSGNLSVRCGDVMLITPSATPYETLQPDMMAAIPLDTLDTQSNTNIGDWSGPLKPSTEWRFHYDILRTRPEVSAVVHTHSTYATALAITRQAIPAVHYMIALFGGTDIRCADYATFGTQALSDHALRALEGRNACLLANHGAIAIGPTLPKAMWLANELETLAKQYYHALQLGNAVILSEENIRETMAAFQGYGRGD